MAPRKAPAPGTADPAVAGWTAIRAHDYLMHIHEGMRQLLRRVRAQATAGASTAGKGRAGFEGAAHEARERGDRGARTTALPM